MFQSILVVKLRCALWASEAKFS